MIFMYVTSIECALAMQSKENPFHRDETFRIFLRFEVYKCRGLSILRVFSIEGCSNVYVYTYFYYCWVLCKFVLLCFTFG